MAKAGRELEIIVAALEKLLSEKDIEIKSPDKIYDYVTQKDREVDVSISGIVGSVKILIVIECRDRVEIEDVTWIEQLVTKRDNIRANKLIALSSTDFTSGAIELAKAKGIELRKMQTFKPEEILTYFNTIHVIFVDGHYQIVKADFNLHKSVKIAPTKEDFRDITSDKKIIVDAKTGNKLSLNQLLLATNNQNDNAFFKDMKVNENPILKILNIGINKEDVMLLELSNKFYRIDGVNISALFGKKSYQMPLQEVKKYVSDEQPLAEMATYRTTLGEEKEVELRIMQDISKKKGQRIEVKLGKNY